MSQGNASVVQSLISSVIDGQDLLTDELEHIGHETLLLHGDADGVVLPAHTERLAEALPNARMSIIEAAGHWPQLDQPALFNHQLQEFLEETR